MKVYIFGAAGSGTTTQGIDLANKLDIPFFDSDLYFWEDTEIPFMIRRKPELRNEMLETAVHHLESYVIGGGSLPNWDHGWLQTFDFAVFLYIPQKLRLERLQQREYQRFGELLFSDAERNRQYIEFMAWCQGYDDDTARGRTLGVHKKWIHEFSCPVLQLITDLPVSQKTGIIIRHLESI